VVNLGDDYLKEKRGWSQRKVDILRFGLIVGLYIFFIYIASNMVWTDQYCRYLLPTGNVMEININETNFTLPPVYELLVFTNYSNNSNCSYVTYCHKILECNYSNTWDTEPCWVGVC